MHLTYPVVSLLPYNNLSTIYIHVTLFWLLGVVCEMDRNEKRAVIKYLTLKGLSAVEISTELSSVLGDKCAVGCYNLSVDIGVSAW